MKKILIFAALFLVSVVLFMNCKDKTLPTSEEQMEKTVNDSITVTDSIKTDKVTPVVVKKDTLTTPSGK